MGLCFALAILGNKRRIFANKENFGKENSLQRKGCKESKEKYSLKFAIFGKFCLENQKFFDISSWKLLFPNIFIHKMSANEKSFFKNQKFYGICDITFIHYYKIESNYVIFINKIFFAFFVCFCKEFEIFFASLQRMKMQRKWPV